jgi:hypothetical protein
MSRRYPPRTRKQILTLAGLAALSAVFGYLTYDEILFAFHSWRWRPNVFIEMKIVLRVLMLAMLTTGAAIGSVIFVVTRARAVIERKKEPIQSPVPTRGNGT